MSGLAISGWGRTTLAAEEQAREVVADVTAGDKRWIESDISFTHDPLWPEVGSCVRCEITLELVRVARQTSAGVTA